MGNKKYILLILGRWWSNLFAVSNFGNRSSLLDSLKPNKKPRKILLVSVIVLLVTAVALAASVRIFYRPFKALVRNTITATVERVVLREINENIMPAVQEAIESALAGESGSYVLEYSWGAYGTVSRSCLRGDERCGTRPPRRSTCSDCGGSPSTA